MAFFWVSVATTWELSPARWAASKSPRNWEVTLRSSIRCTAVSRVIRTSRHSAFPYWFAPRTISPGTGSLRLIQDPWCVA